MPRHVRARIAVCRWMPLALPVGLLVTLIVLLVSDLTQAASTATEALTEWNACELDNAAAAAMNLTAQCTTLALPLCHVGVCDDVDNHTINVFIKRIAANRSTSLPVVWYLPDRPDRQTAAQADAQMTLLYQDLGGGAAVYRMDMRGSGQSTPLPCSADLAVAVFDPKANPVALTDIEQCADDFRAMYGDRLAAFSLSSAAHDVKSVIESYQADAEVVVYALGYGSLVAQRMMAIGVDEVAGYVFDSSIATANAQTRFTASTGDADFGEIGDMFLEWCESDADCAEMFPNTSTTNVSATLEEVFIRLDAVNGSGCSPLLEEYLSDGSGSGSAVGTVTMPVSFLFRQQLSVLMQSSTLRPFIPAMIYRVHRCGNEDETVLTRLFELLSGTIDEQNEALELLFAVQEFSELWEDPAPTSTVLLDRFESARISDGGVYDKLQAFCLFTGSSTPACANVTESTPGLLSYDHDALWDVEISIPESTSVLLLSGDMDGFASLKYASALYNAIAGEGDKQLLVVANGTHNIVDSAILADGSSCGRQILSSFISASGNLTSVDTSCVQALPTASLAVSSAASELILGVSDPYNGELGSSSLNAGSSNSQRSSSGSSPAPSTSAPDTSSSQEIDALSASRSRYIVALIVVSCLLGVVIVVWAAVICRRRRKAEVAMEEDLLRRMRGDEEDDFELLRGLFLSSFSFQTTSNEQKSDESAGAII